MAGSQTKVWVTSAGTVTRTNQANTIKQGCGGNKRFYGGRIGSYDYASWVKFTLDWTGVGKIVRATLVVYTDDGFGLAGESDAADTPASAVLLLKAPFTQGNNADEVFDASDYKPGTLLTTPAAVKATLTKEVDGLNRIDITSLVNAWAPKGVKRSDNTVSPGALLNHGLCLNSYTLSRADTTHEFALWSDNADAELRPTIELIYDYGATVPDVPASLSPSGTVASIGSFAGTFTDMRPTDTLSQSHVQVYSPAKVASAATSDVLTCAAHGLTTGSRIIFTALTGGTPLATYTTYYARTVTATTFKLATANSDATIVNITATGSAMSFRTLLYDRAQKESNSAIVAAVFSHIPDNLHLVRNTTYSWRARVMDQEGQWSLFSALVSVAVTNTDPNAPTLTPASKTYASLDGIQFRGTFTDADAGDRLLAYQAQLSAYASGNAHWDDGESLLWDTGKRPVALGTTTFSTPYGGDNLNAGTYYWRARVWDQWHGVSSWTYATITLSANFVAQPNDSINAIQMRPRAPWRILIKEMAFNTVGGALTGVSATNVLTSATVHAMRVGRKVRFSALGGGTGLVVGQTYYIKTVPSTTTFTVSETYGGTTVDFTSTITSGTLTAVTTRGPGRVVAVLEDANNVGASMLYNSPGEAHWTLGISHPQISVIEPRQTHYAIEFRQGDGWREVFAGLVTDFDASDTDVVFYGIDYLGLLDYTLDEHYDPSNIYKTAELGGSKYVNLTISAIVTDQLKRAREPVNSIVGFISTGAIATMPALITVYSTYQPTLPFVVGLIDSHRAGSGKMSRLWCRKTSAGGYEWVVTDDPGVARDNLRLRYGELVQGYRVVPFGNEWATRVSAVGRDTNGVKVRYASVIAPALSEEVWGRWAKASFIDGVADANDMQRRTRQSAIAASKLGKQVALGLRSGVLQPRDGYDLLDQFYVDIEHGSVSTSAFGSGYWVAVGITWQALQRGDLNTTLTLRPREDSTAPSDDLLLLQEISGQPEWQVGWRAPNRAKVTSRYWFDNTSGKVYVRTGGALLFTGITGTI